MALIPDVCSFFLPIEAQITVTVDTKNRSIQVLIIHLYSLLLTILYVEQTIKGGGWSLSQKGAGYTLDRSSVCHNHSLLKPV